MTSARSGRTPGRSAGRQPARRAPARSGAGSRSRRSRKRSSFGPLMLTGVLVLTVVVISAMAIGPLQRFTAAADRVAELEATRDALREEVDRLEDRKARLSDPEELELLARSELGLVKPGEVPYIVVTPGGDDAEQLRPSPAPTPSDEDLPWYRRLGRALSDLFG